MHAQNEQFLIWRSPSDDLREYDGSWELQAHGVLAVPVHQAVASSPVSSRDLEFHPFLPSSHKWLLSNYSASVLCQVLGSQGWCLIVSQPMSLAWKSSPYCSRGRDRWQVFNKYTVSCLLLPPCSSVIHSHSQFLLNYLKFTLLSSCHLFSTLQERKREKNLKKENVSYKICHFPSSIVTKMS
jgi:hypothetical protein